jgi:hypothetical protein
MTVEVAAFGADHGGELSRAERLAQLRRTMASVPNRIGPAAAAAPGNRRLLPVPEPFADILPAGGLAAGSVVRVEGSRFLLAMLLASVTGAGGHAAVIAQPELGLLAAAELGAELQRVAVIADPGPDPVEVAAVLVDGLDLVVFGLRGASVPPSRARAVTSRARSKGAVLVVTDGQWPGVDVRLEAEVAGYGGIGQGHGRLDCMTLAVRAWGRSFQPRSSRVRLRCCQGRVLLERARRLVLQESAL